MSCELNKKSKDNCKCGVTKFVVISDNDVKSIELVDDVVIKLSLKRKYGKFKRGFVSFNR